MRFGTLTIRERADKTKGSYRYRYWCECDCGNFIKAFVTNVVSGSVASCYSCRLVVRPVDSRIEDILYKKLYHVWYSMLRRCNNESDTNFKSYGGRGIKVCERWHQYDNFRTDMWKSYVDHHKEHSRRGEETQIERVDNDAGYSPSNCVWATSLEQAQNTRIQKERRVSLRSVAKKQGINYYTLYGRVRTYGWDLQKAISTAVRNKSKRTTSLSVHC